METLLYKKQPVTFINMKKVCDILYYDGPLLSHFTSDNENYLYYWVDVDIKFNRWLIFKIENETLESYYKNEKSLRDLILNPIDDFLFCADLDNMLTYSNVGIIYPQDLPKSYIPEEDSFFEDIL